MAFCFAHISSLKPPALKFSMLNIDLMIYKLASPKAKKETKSNLSNAKRQRRKPNPLWSTAKPRPNLKIMSLTLTSCLKTS